MFVEVVNIFDNGKVQVRLDENHDLLINYGNLELLPDEYQNAGFSPLPTRTESGRMEFTTKVSERFLLSDESDPDLVGTLVDIPVQGGLKAVGHLKKSDRHGRVLVELPDGTQVAGHISDSRELAPPIQAPDVVADRLLRQGTFSPTLLIIGVCTLFIGLCRFLPAAASSMVQHGRMQLDPYSSYGWEWWRPVSAIFLHADGAHLVHNMISLLCVGSDLERFYGKKRLTFAFLFTGAASSLFSAAWSRGARHAVSSIGASGAVCGCIAVHHFHRLLCVERAARHRQLPKMLCFLAPDLVLALLPQASLAPRVLIGLAAIVCNHLLDHGRVRLSVLALRLFPAHAALASAALHIDHAGHLGGYLAGLFLGLVLLPNHFAGHVDWVLTPYHQLRRQESGTGAARHQRTRDAEKRAHEAAWACAGTVALAALWAMM